MYINRLLLLVAGIVLIFFPAVESWVFGNRLVSSLPVVAADRDSGLLEPTHAASG
jgi:hypothetical protein